MADRLFKLQAQDYMTRMLLFVQQMLRIKVLSHEHMITVLLISKALRDDIRQLCICQRHYLHTLKKEHCFKCKVS